VTKAAAIATLTHSRRRRRNRPVRARRPPVVVAIRASSHSLGMGFLLSTWNRLN
jgi:hypothetical protein